MTNSERPDIERWIDRHDYELHNLAERADALIGGREDL